MQLNLKNIVRCDFGQKWEAQIWNLEILTYDSAIISKCHTENMKKCGQEKSGQSSCHLAMVVFVDGRAKFTSRRKAYLKVDRCTIKVLHIVIFLLWLLLANILPRIAYMLLARWTILIGRVISWQVSVFSLETLIVRKILTYAGLLL